MTKAETHEQELAEYLQERIKPGLNRGAIPLLARSIAREIVQREHLDGDGAPDEEETDEESGDEAEDQPVAQSEDDREADDDEDDAEEDDAEEDESDEDDEEPAGEGGGEGSVDFEEEMHELQSELGEDWILRFSVEGDNAWLTAEKKDGSQHVEAPTAEVLIEAVELLEQGGEQAG
jgi:hypothetical protein